MAHVHELGHLYCHTQPDPTKAFKTVSRQLTQEIEWPYRVGWSLVLRLGRRAYVVGLWVDHRDETEALLSALGGREIDDDEDVQWLQAGSDQVGEPGKRPE